MKNLVKAVVIFGQLSLCYPVLWSTCRSKNNSPLLSFFNPLRLLQAFLATYSVVFFIDFSLSNPVHTVVNSPKTSVHAYRFMLYIAMLTSDVIIRLVGITLWESVPEFVKNVLELLEKSDKYSLVASRRKKSGLVYIVLAGITAFLLICQAFALVVTYEVLMEKSYKDRFTYHVLPKNELVIRCALAVLDVMPPFSAAFGLMFIVVFGQVLVHAHSKFLRTVAEMLSRNRELNCVEGMALVNENIMDQEEIKRKFIQLQQLFGSFTTIAGGYAFAIVLQATFTTIRAIGVISGIAGEKNLVNETSLSGVNYAANLLAILLIADFGSYMNSNVQENGQRLYSLSVSLTHCDESVHRTLAWIHTWKWEFRALNFFTVNRSLLLSIAGTILTFFIFFFQLQASENGDQA